MAINPLPQNIQKLTQEKQAKKRIKKDTILMGSATIAAEKDIKFQNVKKEKNERVKKVVDEGDEQVLCTFIDEKAIHEKRK